MVKLFLPSQQAEGTRGSASLSCPGTHPVCKEQNVFSETSGECVFMPPWPALGHVASLVTKKAGKSIRQQGEMEVRMDCVLGGHLIGSVMHMYYWANNVLGT